MFSGIITAIGHITDIQFLGQDNQDASFVFDIGRLSVDALNIGDSISVNGVCLTISRVMRNAFAADLSHETLARTTFASAQIDKLVNLEMALKLSQGLHGHIVTGHIDGIGKVTQKRHVSRSVEYAINVPSVLSRFITEKGSIAIDGVSLTVNDVEKNDLVVNIIPHTLSETILSDYQLGSEVNIEVDIVARYLDRLSSTQGNTL